MLTSMPYSLVWIKFESDGAGLVKGKVSLAEVIRKLASEHA